ncbi:TPA: acyl-CoA dehydrogenase [Yersinia enterocolitica]|uniref:acyl-CoA dehydrogenase n=1 Tax=Yersinia enterocolitica TaxID=630 RepID=UPI0021E90F14|nr:acyl-CoA dehydrogenase [Yersinia enterocolitica]EMA9490381.1 acyl-CoA dehydrogenase [Yersinia enterocolitica]UYJ84122.1 acyl-CoA dehydrogenase [Yersinia enterocolitica]UYK13500.1 acyl-CoA dehydrogenase [Yersinia enterocolitica]HEN3585227.1 acyl-CoA dehydrogenase [Yersinia enterocolitica]
MKRVILVTLLLSTSALVTAADYVKPNGALTLAAGGNGVKFSINAASKDASGICNMEGSAQSIGAGENQKYRWLYNDTSSQCVAVISEQNSGKVTVMTKGCEGYCGMTAVGAMDGIYRKK